MLDGLQQRPLADPRECVQSGPSDRPAAGGGPDLSTAAAPRNRDDMSCDDVTKVPRSHDSDAHMSSLVAGIEERLEVLEDELAKVAPIVYERQRLLSARAQLLGEALPPPAISSRRRITREDVVSVLRSHPGIRAGEIARVLGAGQPAISAHLYRGKGTRFRSRGGRWSLVDEK